MKKARDEGSESFYPVGSRGISVGIRTTVSRLRLLRILRQLLKVMLTISVSGTDVAGNEFNGLRRLVVGLKVALALKSGAATPTGDDPLKDFVVPAKSYVIVAKDPAKLEGLPIKAIPANTAEGSSKTTIKEWKDMPNLENLFYEGGSLLLTTLKATLLDRDGDENATPAVLAADQTPQEAAKARDVLITEIMAARNTALVGQDGYLTHQWIEIYNKLPFL